MKPDQALLALERHATSKIRKASDLNKVGTFGFRGKPYLNCSVSRLSCIDQVPEGLKALS